MIIAIYARILTLMTSAQAVSPTFFTNFYFAGYIPLTLLAYAIQHALWGLDPTGYHIFNILLHALGGILVFYLIRRLHGSTVVALIASILFIAHPVQVESVAWISELKSVLSMFFYLLGFLVHIRSSEDDAPQWMIGVSWAVFGLAILSKPSPMAAMGLFMIYDYFWAHKSIQATVLRNIPYGVIGVLGGYAAVKAHDQVGGIKDTPGGDTVGTIQLMSNVFWDYTVSLVAPFNLNNMYVYFVDQISFSKLEVWLGMGVLLGLLLAALWSFYKAMTNHQVRPFILLTVAWVVAFMLPVSNIVPLAIQRADRYMHFPSVTIFMLVGIAFYWIWEQMQKVEYRHVLSGVFGAVVAILVILTVQRNDVWSSSETLWADHLTDYPITETGLLNYGVYYFNTREYDTATVVFDDLLTYFPNHYKGNRFQGLIYYFEEDYVAAIPYLERAIQLRPDENDLNDRLGTAYFQAGLAFFNAENYEQAINYYTNALRISPDEPATYNNLGFTYQTVGDNSNAILFYSLALEVEPEYERAEANLTQLVEAATQEEIGNATFLRGLRAFNEGDYELALAQYQQAAELLPSEHVVYNNIGFTLYTLGNTEQAIESYTIALELNPDYILAYTNLGNVAYDTMQYDLARNAYEAALTRDAQFNATASINYCVTLAELGQTPELAIQFCQQAHNLDDDNAYIVAAGAYALIKFGEVEQGLENAQAAVIVNQNEAMGYVAIGTAQMELGNVDAAREAFNTALNLDPVNTRAQAGLAALQ